MDFYVYVLTRPVDQVFYVGKGSGKRLYQHELEAQRGCTCHKCNIIRKVWREGQEIGKEIVFRTTNEKEAFDYEIELIRYYGRENLANLTDGGDGASGRTISEDGRRRIGEANRNRKHSIFSRIKKSIAGLGRRHSDESKAKISESRKGHQVSLEARTKIGEASRKRGISSETRQKALEANRGSKHTEETIQRMRDRALNRSADSEDRRKQAIIESNAKRRSESPAYLLMDELILAGRPLSEIVSRTGLSERTVFRRKKELRDG